MERLQQPQDWSEVLKRGMKGGVGEEMVGTGKRGVEEKSMLQADAGPLHRY